MSNGQPTAPPSRVALIGALVAILLFATAAVMFMQTNDQSLQRLALLFGLFGVSVPAIISLLKSDAAATQTDRTSQIAKALDGAFDARVQDAVERGNAATAAGQTPPRPPDPHVDI